MDGDHDDADEDDDKAEDDNGDDDNGDDDNGDDDNYRNACNSLLLSLTPLRLPSLQDIFNCDFKNARHLQFLSFLAKCKQHHKRLLHHHLSQQFITYNINYCHDLFGIGKLVNRHVCSLIVAIYFFRWSSLFPYPCE